MNYFKYFSFLFLLITSCDKGDDVNVQSMSDLAHKMKDSIKIIAHRGASAYEPENSLLAFNKAFELYSDGIELDLWQSKDDSLMVFHDINTFRMTGVSYNIPETNSSLLRTLNIGKGEKMPFLGEVFKMLPPGKSIYLDIKWYQYANTRKDMQLIDKFISQIEKSNRIEDCVIVCFEADYLFKIKSRKPELKCMWIAHELKTKTEINDVFSKYDFDGISAHWSIIDSESSESMKNRKKSLFAWVINDKAISLELYEKYRVNGIFTDKPDVVRQDFIGYYK